jgi:hypothetical protein
MGRERNELRASAFATHRQVDKMSTPLILRCPERWPWHPAETAGAHSGAHSGLFISDNF